MALTFANAFFGENGTPRNYIKNLEEHRQYVASKTPAQKKEDAPYNTLRENYLESKAREQEEYEKEEEEYEREQAELKKLNEEKRQARLQRITMARIEREKQENSNFEKKGCIGKFCTRVKRVLKGTHTFKGERKLPKGGKRARTRKSQRKTQRK
jgi:hypothetical protein